MSKLVGFYNGVEKNNNTVTKLCKLASNTGSSVKWIESFIYFSNLLPTDQDYASRTKVFHNVFSCLFVFCRNKDVNSVVHYNNYVKYNLINFYNDIIYIMYICIVYVTEQ